MYRDRYRECGACDVSVIIGATGTVPKGLKINVEAIPAKHSAYSSQKTAILRTYNNVSK
jgi:hypothetical protein